VYENLNEFKGILKVREALFERISNIKRKIIGHPYKWNTKIEAMTQIIKPSR
jgi:hypothetical protein